MQSSVKFVALVALGTLVGLAIKNNVMAVRRVTGS